MAASLVVIGLARAFADLGLSSAIVAKQVRDHNTLSSLYWASLIAGFGVFVVVLALMLVRCGSSANPSCTTSCRGRPSRS